MRQWMWVKKNKEIGGYIPHAGGWADSIDFTKVSADPAIKALQNYCESQVDFHKYIVYICSCPTNLISCNCASKTVSECNVVGEDFIKKPFVDAVIDEITYNIYLSQIHNIPPSTTYPLKLRLNNNSSSIEDGTVINIVSAVDSNYIDMLETSPVKLIFNSGTTGPFNIHTPPKGFKGRIAFQPEDTSKVRRGGIILKGW